MAVGPKYSRLAKDLGSEYRLFEVPHPPSHAASPLAPQVQGGVAHQARWRCAQVNWMGAAAKEVCKASGVEALPTIAIYRAGEQVWRNTVQVRTWDAFVEELERQASLLRGVEVDSGDAEEADFQCRDEAECTFL